ncbi:MAG: hypothetical protein WCJ09_22885 [Planctomycetota bacterium]
MFQIKQLRLRSVGGGNVIQPIGEITVARPTGMTRLTDQKIDG